MAALSLLGSETDPLPDEGVGSAHSLQKRGKPVAYFRQDFRWEELQVGVESNAAISHAWSE